MRRRTGRRCSGRLRSGSCRPVPRQYGEALGQADATPQSTAEAARSFFADWRAAVWVEGQNESKGVA
eukprot:3110137-Lingulodinium_polyedra.AAC.1